MNTAVAENVALVKCFPRVNDKRTQLAVPEWNIKSSYLLPLLFSPVLVASTLEHELPVLTIPLKQKLCVQQNVLYSAF